MVGCGGFNLSRGSVLGAALSLAVTTMGAGILTLPSAYADAGVVPSTLVLVGVGFLTIYSIDCIVMAIEKVGRNSYEELTRELLGKHAEEFIRAMLFVYNIGSAIGYLVVVQDLVTPLQPLVTYYVPWLTTPKHTLLTFWAAVILPMSCVPTLGALHISSFLAIAATSLICVMIVFRYFVPGPTEPSALTKAAVASGHASANWWWGVHPLLAMPIIMFSFDCQSLVFQIYAGLEDMRRSVMMEVSVISLAVSGLIHASVGFFGYLSNPVDVRDNIISNYDPNVDRVFRVGYILYAAPIILAFVIMLFPIRDSIFIVWYGFSSASVATHVPRSKDYTRLVKREEELELLCSKEAVVPVASAEEVAHEHARVTKVQIDDAANSKITVDTNILLENDAKHLINGDAKPHIDGGDVQPHANGSAKPPPGAASDRASSPPENGSANGRSHSAPHKSNSFHHGKSYGTAEELKMVVERKKQLNKVEKISTRDHLIISIALSSFCIAVALVVPGIVSVVAVLGGLCSSTLCFTIPGLYRWRLHQTGVVPCQSKWEWTLLLFMMSFGVIGGSLGTAVAVMSLFS